MPKNTLFIIVFVVIILTGVATLIFNRSQLTSVSKSEIDAAINKAKFLYSEEKIRGRGFINGPCLSDALLPGWVVDIAHSPRLAIDDLPENQCPSYIEGKAQHFVELNTEGDLIRAR
ncbi:hypothetical protein HYU94_00865 [Candidatus Daviesbacteria bacterium]|nr:hypothetical protein [Candidatus Daviesbacteria bacterium]